MLNETLTVHITEFRAYTGYDFYMKLDADYMMEIASEYISSYERAEDPGSQKATSGKKTANQLSRGTDGCHINMLS